MEEMVYNWENVEKAVDLAKNFPWERKLKKIEFFSDSCELLQLFTELNAILCNSIFYDEMAEKHKKKCFHHDKYTLNELKKSRKECESYLKRDLIDLLRGIHTGEYKCNGFYQL